jgi:hypothetical protein
VEVNRETGYLEASGNWAQRGFNSEKKKKFLELAQDYVDKHHNFPPIHDITKAVGINSRTFYEHLSMDSTFKQAWREVQVNLQSHFTQAIGLKANTKQGTLANLAALRFLESGSWVPSGLNPISQAAPSKQLINQFSGAIDAEIVPDLPQLPDKVVTEKPVE